MTPAMFLTNQIVQFIRVPFEKKNFILSNIMRNIKSKNKYASMLLRKIEAVVFIIFQIFCNVC